MLLDWFHRGAAGAALAWACAGIGAALLWGALDAALGLRRRFQARCLQAVEADATVRAAWFDLAAGGGPRAALFAMPMPRLLGQLQAAADLILE
ncbi:MAG: hypothetical protein KatS3mg121_0609 [Gammaproteobacteria bacterium]|nr:MAG: hypothetical protein KatS3mg121_0609 [Gammaproteobacteria bacterium]